jgi:HAD superfamily hydrolase (TIGR01509 family)
MAAAAELKAIIFDIDGTLVDSVDLHARAWQEAFAHFGHQIEFAAVRSQIGKGGDQLMPAFLPRDEVASHGEEIETYRSELFKEKYLPKVHSFPAVRDLVQRIKQLGPSIVLASSAKGEELAAYKRIAGILDLVDEETSSDDAEKSKPHPDIFQAALERLGGDVRPDEVIVIGDSPYDAEAAGKLALRTIGVLSGGFAEHDLRQAGCLSVYRDPADLLQHLDEWAKPSPVAGERRWGPLFGRIACGMALAAIGILLIARAEHARAPVD